MCPLGCLICRRKASEGTSRTAHGINLNNSIVILDKLQVPGPEDLQEVASRVKESKEATS